ncbi:MAG: DUF2017 family protein [Acidimicrobiia bacterium]|nr:DUF2017 family protein [Acidimicrobiia bacterium]
MAQIRRRIARTRRGTYQLRLPEIEQELLRNLAAQLRDMLSLGTNDPSLRRLFPTAYHEDAERDREYQQLVRDELLARRLAALATVEETTALKEVTEEQLSSWLTVLNDLRLVLGTRLDVSEDTNGVEGDDDNPNVTAYSIYDYLGFLLTVVVDALAEGLPPPVESEV